MPSFLSLVLFSNITQCVMEGSSSVCLTAQPERQIAREPFHMFSVSSSTLRSTKAFPRETRDTVLPFVLIF